MQAGLHPRPCEIFIVRLERFMEQVKSGTCQVKLNTHKVKLGTCRIKLEM